MVHCGENIAPGVLSQAWLAQLADVETCCPSRLTRLVFVEETDFIPRAREDKVTDDARLLRTRPAEDVRRRVQPFFCQLVDLRRRWFFYRCDEIESPEFGAARLLLGKPPARGDSEHRFVVRQHGRARSHRDRHRCGDSLKKPAPWLSSALACSRPQYNDRFVPALIKLAAMPLATARAMLPMNREFHFASVIESSVPNQLIDGRHSRGHTTKTICFGRQREA